MNIPSRAAQCQIERQILQHVKEALRITLRWEVDAVGLAQKLQSVRFTAQSFQRHLERLIVLEEEDGYLDVVGETKPNLVAKRDALHREHDEFRATIGRLVPALERMTAADERQFQEVCRELTALLDRLDVHDQNESRLLLEALCEDEGGEG